MLEYFARANAFVMGIDGFPGWFTYHRMLRDLLAYRFAMEQTQALQQAHMAAAEWLFQNGEHVDSIRHSIATGDTAGAGRTFLCVFPKMMSPDGPALAVAIAPLAANAVIDPCLISLLASTTCHLDSNDYLAMRRDVDAARQYLDEAGEARAGAETVLLLFEMGAHRATADSTGVQCTAARVIDIVDRTPRRLLPAGPAFRIIAVINQAGAGIWTGRADDTESILKDAARDALQLGLLLPQLNAISHLALLDAFRGRLTAASSRAAEALAIIDRRGWGSEVQALATYVAQGVVDLARQQPTAASHHVHRGLAASGRQTDRALRLALGVTLVEIAVGRGDAAAAIAADARVVDGFQKTPSASSALRRWSAVAGAEALLLAGRGEEAVGRIVRETTPGGDNNSPGVAALRATPTPRERIFFARAALLAGNNAEIPALMEPLLTADDSDREATVAAHLLDAVLADRGHRDSAALSSMEKAISVAHADDIRRPFVSVGGRVPGILDRYRHVGGRHDFFSSNLVALLSPSRSPATGGAAMIEHLTEREAVVLRYLPTMLKAGEIGADLYVSVNTVKAHLRAIYRKLGAANRREAVEKARAVGLL